MSEQNYRAFWDEALKQIHDEYKLKGLESEFKLWFNMEYVEDTIETDMYSIDDLEQIAEHLLVYCKHNKEA